jgi:hypothetical protein
MSGGPAFSAGQLSLNLPSGHENQGPPVSYSNQKTTWSPFFGEPQREFAVNPYDDFRRENFALPDAYKVSFSLRCAQQKLNQKEGA